jgi:hypothetical protein
MIEKIKALKAEANDIRDRARKLRMKLNELSGVAVVIPKARTYPLNAFRGQKVLLHNVSFDVDNGEVYAVIMLPYSGDTEVKGHKILVNINENWFK